eukprot:1158840-Pelagomonas_calceolata.AAC.6
MEGFQRSGVLRKIVYRFVVMALDADHGCRPWRVSKRLLGRSPKVLLPGPWMQRAKVTGYRKKKASSGQSDPGWCPARNLASPLEMWCPGGLPRLGGQ